MTTLAAIRFTEGQTGTGFQEAEGTRLINLYDEDGEQYTNTGNWTWEIIEVLGEMNDSDDFWSLIATYKEKQPTIEQIDYTLYADHLFESTEGIDIEESTEKYAEMLTDALEAAYPGTDVDISIKYNVQGVGGGPKVTGKNIDAEQIEQEVKRIADKVYHRFDWIVKA